MNGLAQLYGQYPMNDDYAPGLGVRGQHVLANRGITPSMAGGLPPMPNAQTGGGYAPRPSLVPQTGGGFPAMPTFNPQMAGGLPPQASFNPQQSTGLPPMQGYPPMRFDQWPQHYMGGPFGRWRMP